MYTPVKNIYINTYFSIAFLYLLVDQWKILSTISYGKKKKCHVPISAGNDCSLYNCHVCFVRENAENQSV